MKLIDPYKENLPPPAAGRELRHGFGCWLVGMARRCTDRPKKHHRVVTVTVDLNAYRIARERAQRPGAA